MTKKNEDFKHFNMRLPKNMWKFIKNIASDEERAMADVFIQSIKDKYKKKWNESLTST